MVYASSNKRLTRLAKPATLGLTACERERHPAVVARVEALIGAAEAPSHLRAHTAPTRAALVCALLWAREREITDTLVDLLISPVHRINWRWRGAPSL